MSIDEKLDEISLSILNILQEKASFDKAVQNYTLAYKKSSSPRQRGDILLGEAGTYKRQAKWNKAVGVNHLVSVFASGTFFPPSFSHWSTSSIL